MEEKPVFEVRFEVKELTGCTVSSFSVAIDVGEYSVKAQGKGKLSLRGTDISYDSPLTISLLQADKLLGFTKASLGSLFGESLQGKVDRWFKLKSEDFSSLRLKLSGSVCKITKASSIKSSNTSRRSSKLSKDVKCPYLDSLASGQELNTLPLDDLWRSRNPQQSLIKLSLEPDSPSHLESEGSFPAPYIESLTFDILSSLPGTKLKEIVKFLCDESRSFQKISQSAPEKREELRDITNKRRELERDSQKEMDLAKEKWQEEFKEAQGMIEHRENLRIVEREKIEESMRLEIELDEVQGRLMEKKREANLLKNQRVQFSDSNQSMEVLQELLLKAQEKKKLLEEEIEKAREQIVSSNAEDSRVISVLDQENHSIQVKIGKISEIHSSCVAENNSIKLSLNALRSRLHNSETFRQQVDSSLSDFSTAFTSLTSSLSSLSSLSSQISSSNNSILSSHQSLLTQKLSLQKSLDFSESSLESSKNSLSETTKAFHSASLQKISQEQVCCLRADLAQLTEDLSRLKLNYAQNRAGMVQDMEKGSRLLMDESEKVLLQAEKLDHIIDKLDKKEEELDGLKNAMGEVKKRNPPYIPIRDDPVDVALAENLNSRETPVPIKFIRQEGGNYTFGSKKVYIKVENGKLLVKVGGGFTSIDEFLWIYTPVELEKCEASPKIEIASKTAKDMTPLSSRRVS